MIEIIMAKAPAIFKVTVSREVHGNYIWDYFQCWEFFVKKFLREETKWPPHHTTCLGKKLQRMSQILIDGTLYLV